jgi:hypothetical protein
MTLGTKSYYETIIQQARIQFFDDAILINEWIADDNGGIPRITVPTSPGNVVYRTQWIDAVMNIRNWVTGIPLASIIYPITKVLQDFDHNVNKIGDIITYNYIVDDINDVSYILREISYNRGSDQITLAPRLVASTIFWVDYLNQLLTLIEYDRIINDFYKNGYGT